MPNCEWCGNTFDKRDAEDIFETEIFGLSYGNIRKCLCGICSVAAINDEVDGIYFEMCEECGVKFDLMDAQDEFTSNFSWESGTELRDYWKDKILCSDCALKLARHE